MSAVAVAVAVAVATSPAASAVSPAAPAAVHLDVLGKQACSTGKHAFASKMFAKAARESGNLDSSISKEEMVRYALFLKTCMASPKDILEDTFLFANKLTLWDMSELEHLHDWLKRHMAFFTPGIAITISYSDNGKSVLLARSVQPKSTAPVSSFGILVLTPAKPLKDDDTAAMCAEIDDLIAGAADDDEDEEGYFYYD